jgi:hypothetical protein
LIKVSIYIKFNKTVLSIEEGISHLRTVLSTGSSKEICVPSKLPSGLCSAHTDLSVEVLNGNETTKDTKIIIILQTGTNFQKQL